MYASMHRGLCKYIHSHIQYIHTCISVRIDTYMHSYCLYFVLYLTTCKVPRIVQTIQRRSHCDKPREKRQDFRQRMDAAKRLVKIVERTDGGSHSTAKDQCSQMHGVGLWPSSPGEQEGHSEPEIEEDDESQLDWADD